MKLIFSLAFFIIYSFWIIVFIFKIKFNNIKSLNINYEIINLKNNIYDDIISYKKCKDFTKALKRNLRYQINEISFINNDPDKHIILMNYFDCIKDLTDLNDMTFYVGNQLINALLRKKVRECLYYDIILDVVANLENIAIPLEHLFFIFSDLLNMSINYIKNNKNQKNKISVRATENKENSRQFLVIQIAYNIIHDIPDFDEQNYINEYHFNMRNLLLKYYNGIFITTKKNDSFIKTITIPFS